MEYNFKNAGKIKELISFGKPVEIHLTSIADSNLMDLLVFAMKKGNPTLLFLGDYEEHFYELAEVLGLSQLLPNCHNIIISK